MNITIEKGSLAGNVRVIQSKSFGHRIMLSEALARMTSGSETKILLDNMSEDIQATRRVIKVLEEGGTLLDCGESGTTIRFMVPVAAAIGKNEKIRLTGHGRLMERPMDPLIEAMKPHGVELIKEEGCWLCRGHLTPGEYTIAANVSSQYISGLLFALPLLKGNSVLNLTGTVESRPYIDITLDVLRRFGIQIVEEADNRFFIPAPQTYVGPELMAVEGDWSNAAFWLVAGAIGGEAVTVEGLNPTSVQGDMAVVNVLKQFGAKVSIGTVEEDGTAKVTCSAVPGSLKGIELDASHIPDMVPAISIVAAVASGDTKICNAGRLRVKESDRLVTTGAMLEALGVKVTEGEDYLVIHGLGTETCTGRFKGGDSMEITIDGAGDHRIVMSGAVAASVANKPVTILGAEAVNKSYPGFFEEREKLWQVHTEND